jgi:hypothetical protein
LVKSIRDFNEKIKHKNQKVSTNKISNQNSLLNVEVPENVQSSIILDDFELLEPNDFLINMKEKKKNLLMQLFRESGIAKLPSTLKYLKKFLDNKLSGKVKLKYFFQNKKYKIN